MNRFILTALLTSIALSGCGSKLDANENNFGKGISQYLEKEGELCWRVGAWPVKIAPKDLMFSSSFPTSGAKLMTALEIAGVVSSSEVEVDQINAFNKKPTGKKEIEKNYVLTELGKKSYKESQVNNTTQGRVCFGKVSLDKVVKWEGALNSKDIQQAAVTFSYKIENMPDWTKKPEFQEAMPSIKKHLATNDARQARVSMGLTSEGWELKSLPWGGL